MVSGEIKSSGWDAPFILSEIFLHPLLSNYSVSHKQSTSNSDREKQTGEMGNRMSFTYWVQIGEADMQRAEEKSLRNSHGTAKSEMQKCR